MTPDAEPRTKAGKRLLVETMDARKDLMRRMILVIEAEAATPADSLDAPTLARAMAIAQEATNNLIPGHPRHTVEEAAEHWESYMVEASRYADEYERLRPATPADSLDVERLARALDKHEKGIATSYPGPTETSRIKARSLAAEYAALRAEGSSKPPEPTVHVNDGSAQRRAFAAEGIEAHDGE